MTRLNVFFRFPEEMDLRQLWMKKYPLLIPPPHTPSSGSQGFHRGYVDSFSASRKPFTHQRGVNLL